MERTTRNSNGNNTKQYTFLNLKECLGKNGQYHGITVEARVVKPSDLTATASGKEVINFTTPITGRTQYLEKVLGMKLPEKDGTVWARVSCWDRTANRLNKFLDAVESCTLIVTGSIKASVSQDGKYTNVDITADDWTVLRANKSGQQPAQAEQPAQMAQPVQQPVAQPQQAPEQEVYYDSAPPEDAFPEGFVPVDTSLEGEDLPF